MVEDEAVNVIARCFITELLVFKNHLFVRLSLLLTPGYKWAYESWSGKI